MTILVLGGGEREHIATWNISEYPPVFEGYAVGEVVARREEAIAAVEELERRVLVLSGWIVENDPRECAECGGEASAELLVDDYPLCSECSTFETRRRYD